jgi:hypothetical protein
MSRVSLALLAAVFLLGAEMRKDVEFAAPGGVSLTLGASIPEGPGPFPTAIVVHGETSRL